MSKGKILFGAEAAGEFEQDFGIPARLPRRRHGLPDARHPTLGGGHGAFLLLVQRPGENDVCVVRGFVEEKINRAVEFQFLQRLADHVVVGQRDDRIEANRDEPFDLASVDRLHELIRGEPFSRQLFFLDPPDLADVTPMLGVFDVPVAWELVALVAVLASALAIALTGNRSVAAIWLANAAGGEHQINAGAHVLHSLGLVLDTARMHEKACLRLAPPFGSEHNFLFRNTRGSLGPVQLVVLDSRCGFLETGTVIVDELVIEPVMFDELV
jgi:hypothetical protein